MNKTWFFSRTTRGILGQKGGILILFSSYLTSFRRLESSRRKLPLLAHTFFENSLQFLEFGGSNEKDQATEKASLLSIGAALDHVIETQVRNFLYFPFSFSHSPNRTSKLLKGLSRESVVFVPK